MSKVEGALEFTSTNGDTPQMLARVSEFVAMMEEINISFAAVVTLTPSTVNRLETLAELFRQGKVASDPTAADPAASDRPPQPLLWSLTSDARGLRALETLFPYSQVDVDATVAALADGVLFRNQPKAMRRELVVQYGASLVEALGHLPSQVEFDNRRPTWMPLAASVAATWDLSWAEWRDLFALRAGK